TTAGFDVKDHARRRKNRDRTRDLPHRYADRNRVLPAWRDFALRVETVGAEGVTKESARHAESDSRRKPRSASRTVPPLQREKRDTTILWMVFIFVLLVAVVGFGWTLGFCRSLALGGPLRLGPRRRRGTRLFVFRLLAPCWWRSGMFRRYLLAGVSLR